jgi:hypothetical protein
VYKIYEIFHFILKNYFNFKLYENMLIIFLFFYFFIKIFLKKDVMYITPHLHVVKDFWKFEILFNRFLILKILRFHNFQIVSVFLNVDNQLTSPQFFSHQNSFIKIIFSLLFYKIDCFLCNYCSISKVLY